MAEKASLLVLNKSDLADEDSLSLILKAFDTDLPVLITSCLTGQGIPDLKTSIATLTESDQELVEAL
jgi:selenocysteine-specific translation elongation factor